MISISCEEARRRSEEACNRILPSDQLEEFHRHLTLCPHCQTAWHHAHQVEEELRRLPIPLLPPRFAERLVTRWQVTEALIKVERRRFRIQCGVLGVVTIGTFVWAWAVDLPVRVVSNEVISRVSFGIHFMNQMLTELTPFFVLAALTWLLSRAIASWVLRIISRRQPLAH